MKALLYSWRQWLHQRALLGGHIALTKDERWDSNRETFQFLGDLIGPLLLKANALVSLRKVSGELHTKTIDELVSDLIFVQQTIDTRGYADNRPVNYLHPEPRTFHAYLAHTTGKALTPQEAWITFHKHAIDASSPLDEMVMTDEELTDRDYYRRRYADVWNETYEVYRMFAQTVGLQCPTLNR